jgi:hypothetical protein
MSRRLPTKSNVAAAPEVQNQPVTPVSQPIVDTQSVSHSVSQQPASPAAPVRPAAAEANSIAGIVTSPSCKYFDTKPQAQAEQTAEPGNHVSDTQYRFSKTNALRRTS